MGTSIECVVQAFSERWTIDRAAKWSDATRPHWCVVMVSACATANTHRLTENLRLLFVWPVTQLLQFIIVSWLISASIESESEHALVSIFKVLIILNQTTQKQLFYAHIRCQVTYSLKHKDIWDTRYNIDKIILVCKVTVVFSQPNQFQAQDQN